MIKYISLLLIFATLTHAFSPYSKHTLSFTHENDAFISGSPDRYYTSGLGLIYSSSEMDLSSNQKCKNDICKPYKLHFLNFIDPLWWLNNPKFTRYQVGLTQKLFTPSFNRSFRRDDRPFSATLAGFFSVQHRRENSLEDISLSLGVVGKNALGKQTQNGVHHFLGVSSWEWDNQIPSNISILLSYDYLHRFYLFDTSFIGMDIAPFGGFELGNYNANVSAGSYVRVGYQLKQSLLPSRLHYGIPSASIGNGLYIYAFGSVRGLGIGYNRLITGVTSSFNDLSIRHLNYAFEWGVAVGWKGFSLIFSRIYQGKEFEKQPELNPYGSLALSVAF